MLPGQYVATVAAYHSCRDKVYGRFYRLDVSPCTSLYAHQIRVVAASARGVEERAGAAGLDHVAAAAALHEGLAGGVVGINQEGAATLPGAYAIVVATYWKSMSRYSRFDFGLS